MLCWRLKQAVHYAAQQPGQGGTLFLVTIDWSASVITFQYCLVAATKYLKAVGWLLVEYATTAPTKE